MKNFCLILCCLCAALLLIAANSSAACCGGSCGTCQAVQPAVVVPPTIVVTQTPAENVAVQANEQPRHPLAAAVVKAPLRIGGRVIGSVGRLIHFRRR